MWPQVFSYPLEPGVLPLCLPGSPQVLTWLSLELTKTQRAGHTFKGFFPPWLNQIFEVRGSTFYPGHMFWWQSISRMWGEGFALCLLAVRFLPSRALEPTSLDCCRLKTAETFNLIDWPTSGFLHRLLVDTSVGLAGPQPMYVSHLWVLFL